MSKKIPSFKQRAKHAWRVLFPLSEVKQKKVFEKIQKEAFMEKSLVQHIVDFYVGSVAYNLYSEASNGEVNSNFFHDMLSETIMLSGLKGVMKDILVVQVKEAVGEGYLKLEDEGDLSTFDAIPIDLTEKGKTYIMVSLRDGMIGHFESVIEKIDAVSIEAESDETEKTD